MDMLSINEKLIYSSLIGYSIRLSDDFLIDGSLDSDYLNTYLISNANSAGYARIPLILPSIREMANEMGIARNTLKKTLNKFKEIRLITYEGIICHKDLFDEGYMTLPTNLGIRGQLLLFYTFLEYRSRSFNGTLDTWVSRLVELTGFNEGTVYNMLHKLHERGLTQRLPDGKLKVKPIAEQ